jgi:putative peptidoglycan lipid II flippase
VRQTALFFALYTLSLFLWSAQAIYARSFYAAGITWLPMLASTILTLVAFRLYSVGYHWYGAAGLALASDAGIALQAISLAVLLHQRRMVSLASLDYLELGRCLLAAAVSGVGVGVVFGWLGGALHRSIPGHTQWIDLAVLVAGTALWLAIAKWVLEKSGSALPRVAMKRLGLG